MNEHGTQGCEIDDVQAKDRERFDRIAAQYAQKDIRPSASWPRRRRLRFAVDQLVGKGPLGTVLDVGCGPGAPAWYLADRFDRYVGVDHSRQMVEMAKQLHHDEPRSSFIQCSGDALPLEDASVDLVLYVGALHHMPQLEQAFAAARRVARPGAMLLAIEPNRSNPLIGAARWTRAKLDSGYSEDQQFFAPGHLRDALERAQLSQVQIRYFGWFSKPFGQMVLPCEPVVSRLSRAAVALDEWLAGRLPRSIAAMSWDLVAAGHFPDGGHP